jgi:hypothetical protein
MNPKKKRTTAKVIGTGIVGLVGAIATKKLVVGSGVMAIAIGAALTAGAHEAFDAPVSGWVYKKL